MKMFVWKSQALANYGPGLIIAVAETKEAAIEKAWEGIEKHLSDYFDWADSGYLNEKRESFQKDLDKSPQILDTLLVTGYE